MVTNGDVIRTLERVADLLEITGENVYKVRAYRTAAVQVENLGEPLAEIAAGEGLLSLGGFGPAIADKVSELLATGRLGFLEELESQVPPTLLSICELPGVGPRTVALPWLPEREQVEVAGSFRRGGDSVGDLDLVVATRDRRMSSSPSPHSRRWNESCCEATRNARSTRATDSRSTAARSRRRSSALH